jgi:GntR family transcriptional regulator of arabinose operon
LQPHFRCLPMMTQHKEIGPVVAVPGQPLYESVKQALTEAIDSGYYQPGKRMPSTKELSRQMSVSLVTAHRALQELVTVGLLERTRGRGTYVVENHRDIRPKLRVGVVMHRDVKLSNVYHSGILEGMHRAAVEFSLDLLIQGDEVDTRQDVHAYVLIDPAAKQLETMTEKVAGKLPIMVVGARSEDDTFPSIDTDNRDLVNKAVNHLYRLGHRRIGCFIGGCDFIDNDDLYKGFIQACKVLGIDERDRPIVEMQGSALQSDDKLKLNRMISERGLTAVFAGGYNLALEVYQAASTIGLKIPEDLTVVGVDDPPSAAHLSPPLTTLRQPLVHLGHAAISGVFKSLSEDDEVLKSETLRAELVIRRSSSAPRDTD